MPFTYVLCELVPSILILTFGVYVCTCIYTHTSNRKYLIIMMKRRINTCIYVSIIGNIAQERGLGHNYSSDWCSKNSPYIYHDPMPLICMCKKPHHRDFPYTIYSALFTSSCHCLFEYV